MRALLVLLLGVFLAVSASAYDRYSGQNESANRRYWSYEMPVSTISALPDGGLSPTHRIGDTLNQMNITGFCNVDDPVANCASWKPAAVRKRVIDRVEFVATGVMGNTNECEMCGRYRNPAAAHTETACVVLHEDATPEDPIGTRRTIDFSPDIELTAEGSWFQVFFPANGSGSCMLLFGFVVTSGWDDPL